MNINDILQQAVLQEASDIFIIAGLPVTYKCKGQQIRSQTDRLVPATIKPLIDEIYEISARDRSNYEKGIDDDFSFSISSTSL